MAATVIGFARPAMSQTPEWHQWSFDEPNGRSSPQVVDLARDGNHGSFQNIGDQERSRDIPLPLGTGRSLRFVAANAAYVSLARRITFRDSEDFSIALWYRGTESDDNSYLGRVLVGSGSGDAVGNLLINTNQGDLPNVGKVEFRYFGGGDVIRSTSVVNDGVWHHIALVNHGTTRTADLYIDGVAQVVGGSANNRDDWDSAGQHFYVQEFMRGPSMAAGPNRAFTDGMLDDVRLCRCSYTPANIAALRPLYRWSLDESDGRPAPQLLEPIHQNHGTFVQLHDGARTTDTPIAGLGRALRFEAGGSVTLAERIVLRDTDDFTLALWYRGTESDDNGYLGRVLLGGSGNDIAGNLLIATNAADPARAGRVEFRYFGGGDTVRSTSVVTDGRWHHIAYVNHGATKTGDLYIDGVAEAVSASANNRDDWDAANLHFYVAGFMRGYSLANGPGQAFTDGELDDIRICRCSFAVQDIRQLLAAYEWTFDEANGQAAPQVLESISGNHGTFRNLDDGDRSAPPVGLDDGRALRFTSADSAYVSLARRITLRDIDDFTLSLWYRGTEADDNGVMGRVLIGGGGDDVAGNLQIATDASDPENIGKVEFRYLGGGDRIRSTSVINDGRWHHIAYVNHGATKTGSLYVDGVQEVFEAPANNRDDWDAAGFHYYVRDFMRGYSLSAGQSRAYTDGELDDVRICRCRYTLDEVRQLAVAQPLWDYRWTFDEPDGQPAPQALDSISGNHGTFRNIDDSRRTFDVPRSVGGGRALRFTAADRAHVVLRNRITFSDTDEFSIALWYRGTESTPNGNLGRVLVGGGGNDIAGNLQIVTDPSDFSNVGKVEFRYFGGGSVIRSTSVVNDGRWHHIAYVNHGHTRSGDLYIDGAAQVRSAPANNRDDWDAMNLRFYVEGFMRGYSVTAGANNAFTDGELDDVRICQCTYTQDEIERLSPPLALTIHRWSLDEPNGLSAPQVLDQSVYGVHGTFHNLFDSDRGISVPPAVGAGRTLRFTASSRSYVSLAESITLRDTEDFTLALWYRGTEADHNGIWGRMLLGSGLDTTAANLQIAADNADAASVGKVEFRYLSTGDVVRSASRVNDGRWHHIAYVNHGATRTGDLYIDGVAEALAVRAQNSAEWKAAGRHFVVRDFMRGYSAASGVNQAFTDGELDEISICRCSFTAAEVQRLFPSHSWSFDDPDGRPAPQALEDAHGNHGTFGNLTDADRTTDVPAGLARGRALRFFAARGSHLSIRDRIVLRDSEDFTLALWYRGTESDPNGSLGRNLLGTGAGDGVASLQIATDPDDPTNVGKVEFRYLGGGGVVRSSSRVNDGIWHHIVYVNHGATQTGDLYVDGIAEAVEEAAHNRADWAAAGLHFYVQDFMRGYSATAGANQAFTDGDLDEVRICRCSFSADAVRQLAAAASQGPSTSPVLLSEYMIRSDYAYAYGVASADLDLDGDPDLVSGNAIGGTSDLYWFENDGVGNFEQHLLATGEPGWLERLALADLTGDGRPDVVIVNNKDHHVIWFENNSRPGAGVWNRHVVTSLVYRPYDVDIADFDGDGRRDVVVTGWDGLTTWHRNPGVREMYRQWPQYVIDNTAVEPRTIRVGDFNGDGKPDLLATSAGAVNVAVPAAPSAHGSFIAWYENTGSPASTGWVRHIIDNETRAPVHGEPIDMDADGDLDIVMAFGIRRALVPESMHHVAWYENVGTPGRGVAWQKRSIGNLPYAFEAVAGDMDADGDIDVVASAWAGGDRVVWFENGGAQSSWTMRVVKDHWPAVNQIILKDLDANGLLDIIGTADDGSSVVSGASDLRWWRNSRQ